MVRPSPPNRIRKLLSINHLHLGFASVPPKVHMKSLNYGELCVFLDNVLFWGTYN